MQLRISKKTGESVGLKSFEPFGIDKDSWGYRGDRAELNLGNLGRKKLAALRELLEGHKSIRGVGVLLKDVVTWITALDDATQVKPRTVRQFEALLGEYLLKVPGQRLYQRFGEDQNLAYYVNEIDYRPEQRHSDGSRTPAHVNMELQWDEFGGLKEKSYTFWEADCRGMTIPEALARKSFTAETAELRAAHLTEIALFSETINKIGTQYLAVGTGVDDLDGNPSSDRWYASRTHTIQMVRAGSPTRCVVDVFYEEDDTARRAEREDSRYHTDHWFWRRWKENTKRKDKDDEDFTDEADEWTQNREAEEEIPEVAVPIHPMVAVFDLSKHLRLRVHVNYLTPYVYDKTIAEKLIIPDELKDLVKMLIEHRDGGFNDIIKGKGGGAVVLLTGRPGVGKTLTAEVYAESEGRALYTIQCSQLGMTPDDLEDNLLKTFARARRWNAVMLLGEADVYVRERGQDLTQNAIVGVFLRVLEYQSSVLFLTSNRPNDIDDAIASRCIARINYRVPTPEEQARIWAVLAAASGANLSPDTIATIVTRSPEISGRDVKNLLKLAMLMKPGQPVDAATVDFVKKFRPSM